MLLRAILMAAGIAAAAAIVLAGCGVPGQSALATLTNTVTETLTPPSAAGTAPHDIRRWALSGRRRHRAGSLSLGGHSQEERSITGTLR
jgi:hypothetical protein